MVEGDGGEPAGAPVIALYRDGAPHGPPPSPRIAAGSVAKPARQRVARLGELDSLRGIAALAVMLLHLTDHPGSGLVFRWGAYGVELFFVISGFVILLTAERRDTVSAFFVSRVARLFPAYWFCALVSYALVYLHCGMADELDRMLVDPATALMNLTMTQNFFGLRNIDPSYWTLAYELSFYVYIGIALATGQLRNIEKWCLVWLVVDLIFLGIVHPNATGRKILIVPYGNLFVAGMMLYRIWNGAARPITAITLAAAILVSLCNVGTRIEFPSPKYALVQWIAIGLVACAVFLRPRILSMPPLRWLGRISYSLYLIHLTLGTIAEWWLLRAGVPAVPSMAITALLVITVATFINRAVERPGERALKSLLSRRLHTA